MLSVQTLNPDLTAAGELAVYLDTYLNTHEISVENSAEEM
jgi:hypothetical protein